MLIYCSPHSLALSGPGSDNILYVSGLAIENNAYILQIFPWYRFCTEFLQPIA